MRIELRCKACANTWELRDEPRGLAQIVCPRCDVVSDTRASEDLASAVEDALCQLWQVGQTVDVQIRLSSSELPSAFLP